MPRGNVNVRVTGDASDLSRATRGAERDLDRFGRSSSRSLGALKTAAAGAGVAAAGFAAILGVEAVKAAAEAEKSQARLVAQLKANGVSWKRHADEIDRVIQKHSLLAGIDDEDLQDAFTNIIRVTGDVDKGLRLVGLASDIARAKQMDVAKAGELVAKVAGGNIGILARYGIVIKEGSTATQALGQLQQKFAGQAKAYGQTTQGSLDRVSVAFENIAEKLGTVLAPHLAKAANWTARFVRQMEAGTGAGGKFVNTLKDIWGAIRIVINVLVVWNTWLLKIPKLWIEVGKTAVRWAKAIAGAVKDAFNAVKKVVGDVIAGVLGRFAKLFEVASKLPIIGGKFKGIAEEIRGAQKRADRFGESVRDLPDEKDIKVKVKFNPIGVDPFSPNLANPIGSGRPVSEFIDDSSQRFMKKWAKKNPGKLSKLVGPQPGAVGPLGSRPTGANDVDVFNQFAAKFGLQITSGFRAGDPGWHGQDRARDYSNGLAPTPQMMAFAQFMANNFGQRLIELIYSPMGFSIKNGQRTAPYAVADHYDHVHVAMQRGGKLPGSRTGDKNLAALEDGEFVVNRKATSAALPFLQALNKNIPRFQGGGLASLNRIFPEHGLGEPGFQMSFNAVRRVFEAVGADPRTAYIFATIAKGESSLYPGIRGDDPGGTKGWGLVQNTPGVWSSSSKTYQLMERLGGEAALRNPFVNAKVALSLLKESSWGAWYGTRYKHDPGPGVESALTRRDRAMLAGKGFKGGGGDKPRPEKPSRAELRARTPVRGARTTPEIQESRYESRLSRFDDRSDRAPGKREQLRILQLGSFLGGEVNRAKVRLRAVNKALKGKLKPATRQRLLEEKATLLSNIQTWQARRRELGERFAFTPEAEAVEAGEAAEAPSPFAQTDMQAALARLTPGTEDDLAALRGREYIAGIGLALNQQSGNVAGITEWANELASTREAIESLTGTIAEANRIAEEREAINKEIVENQKKILALKDQGNWVVAAVAAAVNGAGGIGGMYGLGQNTPAAGRLARY